MSAVVKVLIVEDNEVYRATLELLLDGRDGLEVVGSIGAGDEAAEAVTAFGPDVVLMDFRLPGLDGAGATAAVLATSPHTAVICLTAEATNADRLAVLEAGAVGLVEKGCPTDELVKAIRSARQRGESNP